MTRRNRRTALVTTATVALLAFAAPGTAAADPRPADRAPVSAPAAGGACCYQ
ncbi:hypothetical protein HS048_35020 [Planomonospora sp. ID91781]|uniref:hypothetical protein n=1 Tax=Planomonospora TaxID=1998 RepID=UPI0016709F8C|nr:MULTISPECIES: hypothetical protein [Planomonospora]MBG0825888.1 hypothetical protein [Planomonospora sp. ID91781]